MKRSPTPKDSQNTKFSMEKWEQTPKKVVISIKENKKKTYKKSNDKDESSYSPIGTGSQEYKTKSNNEGIYM
jgi:hypothetical protein